MIVKLLAAIALSFSLTSAYADDAMPEGAEPMPTAGQEMINQGTPNPMPASETPSKKEMKKKGKKAKKAKKAKMRKHASAKKHHQKKSVKY